MRKADPAKFVTRGNYEQNPGYPLWLASVLDDLYANPPQSARELIERSAKGMTLDVSSLRYTNIKKKLNTKGVPVLFGPIERWQYGCIQVPREHFWTCDTERDYDKTLARIYPGEYLGSGSKNPFKLRCFSYPVPGTERKLELMQLGRYSDLMGEPDAIDDVAFRHPPLTHESYEDFMLCMEDLFSKARDHKLPLEEREHAVIASFWIMAQATPVLRGGTAHAKLVLEYLAAEAGMKVPHTREGYDIWAEAACSDLPDFERRFREGAFFEPEVTSTRIMAWHQTQVKQRLP